MPAIITVAKQLAAASLPISAVLINQKVYEAIRDNSGKIGTFGHGYTYTGHPVSAAVALETLKIYEERNILAKVRDVAPTFRKEMQRLASHPLVGEVRCVGLVGAVEMVKDKATKESFDPKQGLGAYLVGRAQEHGLILRAVVDSVAF